MSREIVGADVSVSGFRKCQKQGFITKSQKHVEAAEADQQTPESKALFFINKTTQTPPK